MHNVNVKERWPDVDEHPWPLDFVAYLCGLMKMDEKETSDTLKEYVETHGYPS